MPTALQKEAYNQIMGYFDDAENIVNLVEQFPEESALIIEDIDALLLELEENAEMVAENFLKYVQSGKVLSGVEKMRIEKAQKKINEALTNFLNNHNL